MADHHVEVMPGDCIDIAWGDGETMSQIIVDDELQMSVYPMPIEGALDGEEPKRIKISLVNERVQNKIDREHKPTLGPHKKFLILPIFDADPGMIFDILANAADQIEKVMGDDERAKFHIGNIRRITAELGWYQEDVFNSDTGAMVDVFRITAFVTEEDPRPDTTEGVVND